MGQHDRQPSLKIAMPVIPNVDGLNVVIVFDLDLIVGKGQTDRLIVCNVIRLLGEHRIIRNATLLIRALKECKPLPKPKSHAGDGWRHSTENVRLSITV